MLDSRQCRSLKQVLTCLTFSLLLSSFTEARDRQLGGCASFSRQVAPDSACRPAFASGSPVKLTGDAGRPEHKPGVSDNDFEAMLFDPAFTSGVRFDGGAAQIEFQPAAGEYLLEVVITDADRNQRAFRLIVDGEPKGEWKTVNGRVVSLVTWVRVAAQPVKLVVETDARHYVLAAARWSTRADFERLAPRLLERARYWFEHPIYGRDVKGAFTRATYLTELLERARLSGNRAARAEATSALARARYWLATEYGVDEDLRQAGRLLSEAAQLAPQDSRLKQTLSAWCRQTPNFNKRSPPREDFCDRVRPTPWRVAAPPSPAGAPAWATEQRKLAARLNAITRWWAHKRQRPNGELGGGWSDDVELLRYWGPLALGFGDADAAIGLRRLGEGVWTSGFVEHGYERRIRDVEHGAEPVTDTLPLMIALDPDDEGLRARHKQASACLKNWIAQAPDGHWRFRGAWFNCAEFDPRPERALDVNLNTRAAAPALWLAYLTRDQELIQLLARWGEAWVASMRQTAAGKPAGIFPPAVQSGDGGYLIRSTRWWEPDAEWQYFNWAGQNQESVASLLLALHDLTAERRWLDAAGESFAPVTSEITEPPIADELRKYPQAFLEWRRRSGDARYDRYFDFSPEVADERLRLQQLRDELTRTAREAERKHSFDWAMYTSEALFTDRVYYPLPALYRQRLFGGEAPSGERYPTFAVTWPESRAPFARAVLTAAQDRLALLLYGFAGTESEFSVRAWGLAPGRYRWTLQPAEGGAPIRAGSLEITRRAQLLTFPLPARQEMILRIFSS